MTPEATEQAAGSKKSAAAAATNRQRKKIRVKSRKRKSKSRVWKTRWVRAGKPGGEAKSK